MVVGESNSVTIKKQEKIFFECLCVCVYAMEDLSLGQLFSLGQKILTELENTSLSSSDPEYQSKVNKGIAYLNQADAFVSRLHLFSENEIIDDINTNDIKFLLIIAYLGDLTLRLTGVDNRGDTLNKAKV